MPKPTTVLRKPTKAERSELALMKSKGTPFEVLRSSFILGLSEDSWLKFAQAGKLFGFCRMTSMNLIKRFNHDGPDACRYHYNELASIARCKLSFEAQTRAVEIAKSEAMGLAGIMQALVDEGLVDKGSNVGPWALCAAIKRGGMSFQRTRYSLKKNATPPSSTKPGSKSKG